MAGPAFKELTAAIKADILEQLRKSGRSKLVDRNGLYDDGLTVAGYVDYHLAKPLLNLRDDQPTREQVIEAVDKIIAKAFAKDSQAINDFKKIKLTDIEIDRIIKNRMIQFKEDYHPKWKAATRTTEQKSQAAKDEAVQPSSGVVIGRKEPLTPRRNSNEQPPNRPLPPDPVKKAATPQSSRPLPATPVRDITKPPAKKLPPDPIVGGDKTRKKGPNSP